MNFQIPFILLPGIFPPPIAGRAPRTGSGQHLAAQPLKKNAGGAASQQFHRCGNGRAEDAKTRPGFDVFALPSRMNRAAIAAGRFRGFHRSEKPPHAKFSRAACVHQSGRADIPFADHVRDARDGQLQFFRIRKAGKKQAALRGARPGGFRRQHDFANRRSRRIRLQLQAQQFQKHFGIPHGHGKPQFPFVHAGRIGAAKHFLANVQRIFESGLQLETHAKRRQPPANAPPGARRADRAAGPAETKEDRVPRRRRPAPSLPRKNGRAPRSQANARWRRAPVRAGGLLPARGVRKAAKPAGRQRRRTCARPSGSMFRRSPRTGKARRRANRPDDFDSCPSGITVIPGKPRAAIRAVSTFEAMATFDSKPHSQERCTRCAPISFSAPNKWVRPERSRTIASCAASSIRGETDQPISSNTAWAIFSCGRERGRISKPANCAAFIFVIPSSIPACAAFSLMATTLHSGGLPSIKARARSRKAGSARTTACRMKLGTKMEANAIRSPAERQRDWRNSSPFSGPSSRAVYAG